MSWRLGVGTPALFEGLKGKYKTVCPLSLDCRWSGPHTCLCTPALPATHLHHSIVTHLTPCLNTAFLHHRYLPPWAYMMWNLQGLYWVISNQNTHSLIKVAAGSPSWIPQLGSFNVRPICEPTELMCNVSLHCCPIGGLPFPCLLHILLGFSHFFTSIVPPETPHVPAWTDFSLSLSQVQHTAKKIPQTGVFLTNRCPEKPLT